MDAIPYLFKTSVLLLVLSLGHYLLLRRETFFQANRLILWLSLVGALWLPLVKLPDLRPELIRYFAGVARRFEIRNHIIRDLKSRIVPTPRRVPRMNLPPGNESQVQIGEVELPAQSFSWMIVLGSIYCFVAGFLLVRFLVQLRSLLKLIDRSAQTDYEDFTLATNESVDSPFSFFRWVVLNPAQHTPDEQEQILRHERVHVRQWHSLDTLLAEVLCIVCWFNPGAWLFRRLVHQTLEYIADRAVLQEGVDARAYQYNLLKVTLSANNPTISNHFSQSELKNRIIMMNKHKSRWYVWLKYPLVIGLILGVATAFSRPKVINLPAQALTEMKNFTGKALATASVTPSKYDTVSELTSLTVANNSPLVTTSQTNTSDINYLPTDTLHFNPSRYLKYEGGLLYWLVTPKTTLEDLTIIKQELAKYGYRFQPIEVKYDPLYSYITRAELVTIFPKGGSTHIQVGESGAYEPISSRGGYVIINEGQSAGGTVYIQTTLNDSFRQVAEQEEQEAQAAFKVHKMDYMLSAGETLIPAQGSSIYRKPEKYLTEYNDPKRSCLIVKGDGTLVVYDAIKDLSIYINNKLVSHEAVSSVKVNQLFAFVVRENGDLTGKNLIPKGLLLYVNED